MSEVTYYQYTFERVPVSYDINVSEKAGSIEQLVEFCRQHIGKMENEHFLVFALDDSLNVIGFITLYIGGRNNVPIIPSEIFKLPIRLNSDTIIVVHNHTINDVDLTFKDEMLMEQIKEAGDILGIRLEAFIIVSDTEVRVERNKTPYRHTKITLQRIKE